MVGRSMKSWNMDYSFKKIGGHERESSMNEDVYSNNCKAKIRSNWNFWIYYLKIRVWIVNCIGCSHLK